MYAPQEIVTIYEDNCPSCGQSIDCYELWDYSSKDTIEVECPHCDTLLKITANWHVAYEIEVAGGDE